MLSSGQHQLSEMQLKKLTRSPPRTKVTRVRHDFKSTSSSEALLLSAHLPLLASQPSLPSSSIACVLPNPACPHPFDLSRLQFDHALIRFYPEASLHRSHPTPRRWLTVSSTPLCRGGPSLPRTCRITVRPTNGGEGVQRNTDRSGIRRSTRRTSLRRERGKGLSVKTNTWAAAGGQVRA